MRKQHKVAFNKSSHRRSEILELVYSDVCGPMKVKTIEGGSYFVTFIDDCSRKVWAHVLKSKDQERSGVDDLIEHEPEDHDVRIEQHSSRTANVNNANHNNAKSALQDDSIEDDHEAIQGDTLDNHDILQEASQPDLSIQEGNPKPRYKVRLVVKGYAQRHRIDYGKIFSPIIKMISIRLVLGLAVSLNMKIEQLDIKTAFLHDNLEENIFMKQPEGFKEKGKEDITCKLQKSLYGLNQAPRQWTNRI
ncbi:hypothetical protein LIER_17844 [Lithospermum erythrorhizon]|uniref:Reverse transcriptase Ty1/copia-type domain-containing protein n=1 Tax=Lithospermum erythrorhizon TaxID=34254 RepID=A0AAV3QCX0_LITER